MNWGKKGILNFIIKGQQTPDAKTVLSKKTNDGDINFPDSGLYYGAIITKGTWYCTKVGQ